jgi:hypothetical protein
MRMGRCSIFVNVKVRKPSEEPEGMQCLVQGARKESICLLQGWTEPKSTNYLWKDNQIAKQMLERPGCPWLSCPITQTKSKRPQYNR